MKKVLFIIALMLLPMLASAQDAVEIDGIWYNLDTEKKTAEVTRNPNKYQGDITIPDAFECNEITYGVISICREAFAGCSGLTSVIIPNSVTSIGENAFFRCRGLTSVTIGNGVTSIGNYAFEGCGLTSVTIPGSVTSIGRGAFYECSGLTSIMVDASNKKYMSLYGVLFNRDGTLITFPEGIRVTAYTIPNGVTSIGEGAFAGCSGLTSVTIPGSVTTIGYEAFYGTGWYNSQSDGVLYLDNWLLGYKGGEPTGAISIADGTKGIAVGAFAGCRGLTSVTIPGSVTSIGERAFYQCSGLTSVTIPNSVTSIGERAFYQCSGLTSVTIPNSVTSIGEWAFAYSGLTSVSIGNSVTSIGENAFFRCRGLTSVTIGNGVTSIGNYAFEGCGLTSVTIGSGVTSIGSGAFRDCSGLTSVTIPNSVTSIGYETFYGCSGLTSITIGDGVTYINNQAFAYCSGMLEMFCYAENVPKTAGDPFNCSNRANATLHVPAGSVEAYKAAEPWKQFKEILALEGSGDYDPKFDLNNDGVVNAADVVTLVNYIMGK